MSAIGTLTFIEPDLNRYGAVGHIIPGFNKNKMKSWCIRASAVNGVRKGEKGVPGTKMGSVVNDSGFWGTIEQNTRHGIFGEVHEYAPNPYFKEPIRVAGNEEIEKGPAKIYTVVDGEKVEEFNVMIETVIPKRRGAHDILIHVIDPDLIQKTGGIVKGMSGSPIIQNGMLIGAVSHISANNSLRGYGVFIEKMIMNLGLRESAFSFQSISNLFSRPALGLLRI